MGNWSLRCLVLWCFAICCLSDFMIGIECITSNNSDSNSNSNIIKPDDNQNNKTPIVGILSQEVSPQIKEIYKNRHFKSYIASSYVKFIESAGGRAVPIFIGKPREYYEELMSKINGVLFPGGAVHFNQSDGYADAGRHIYEIAMQLNDNGVHFPLWGTCLGFELLVHLSANSTELRTVCSSEAQSLPLTFLPSYGTSKLFKTIDFKILNILRNEPVTANFHTYCFSVESFKSMSLDNHWKILSVNKDWNNYEFISSIEHVKYPFFAVQFHPEKNMFEFIKDRNISHTLHAIMASQALANFFIEQTRLSKQHFNSVAEERAALIYNYIPMYTAPWGSSFEQQYLFEDVVQHNHTSNANLIISSILPITVGLLGHYLLNY